MGSRFTLRVPIADVETPPSVLPIGLQDPALENLADLEGATVLVLEDDRDARVAIVELLETYGVVVYSSAVTEDVISAFELSDARIDAIVCDYSLGRGRKGTEVIDELRERLGYAPMAVLITGDSQAEMIATQAGAGVVVFKKPFAPNVLLSVLTDAVRGSKRAGPNDKFTRA